MSNFRIFSKVLGDSGKFKKYILDNISKLLNANFFNKLKNVETQISDLVIQSIRAQPEYGSLKSGILRNEFGLPNTGLVDAILDQLNDIQVQIIKPSVRGNAIQASFVLNMVKENFSEILSSSSASFVTEKGSQIDWLRWLLLEGNNSVIIGYRYVPKSDPRSRTGRGIMISGESAIYRVHPDYRGTADDNWITRGVEAALPSIESYINNMVQKSL